MKQYLHRIAFLFCALAGLSIFIPFEAFAQNDCPALRTVDKPNNLHGLEVYKEDGSRAVRLLWKNSMEFSPTQTEIYRKTADTTFTRITSVLGNTETYLDTSLGEEEAGAAYALFATYKCGGTLWSKPVFVPLTRSFEQSEPTRSYLSESDRGTYFTGEKVWFYVEDEVGGIDKNSVKINTYNGALTIPTSLTSTIAASNYGYTLIGADIPSTTDIYINVDAKNQHGFTLDGRIRPFNFDAQKPEASLSLDGIVAGDFARAEVPSTFTVSTDQSSGSIITRWSTNRGDTWKNREVHSISSEETTISITPPSTSNLLYVLEVSIEDSSGTLLNRQTIPLFRGLSRFAFEFQDSFVAKAAGTLTFHDAYTGQAITQYAENPWTNDSNILRLIDGETRADLKPGAYYITAANNNYIPVPTEESILEANPHGSALHWNGGNTTFQVESISQYAGSRTELSPTDIGLLQDTIAFKEFGEVSYEQSKFSKEEIANSVLTDTDVTVANFFVEQSQKDPLQVTVSYCTAATCYMDSHTSESDQLLDFDYTTSTGGLEGTGTMTRSSSKAPTSNLTAETLVFINNTFSFFLEKDHANGTLDTATIPFKIQYFSDSDSYRLHIPITYLTKLYREEGFIFLNTPPRSSCDTLQFQMKINGEFTPITTYCENGVAYTLLFPQSLYELRLVDLGAAIPTTAADEWYSKRMRYFDRFGFFDLPTKVFEPHVYISRGELAHLIHKTLRFPTGSYKSSTDTFVDLPPSHTYASELLGLVAYYIMSGDDSETNITMRPDDPINRAEALKIITKAIGELPTINQEELAFPDVNLTDWFYPYVRDAFRSGIIEGVTTIDGKKMNPGEFITRAEATALIDKAIQAKVLSQ